MRWFGQKKTVFTLRSSFPGSMHTHFTEWLRRNDAIIVAAAAVRVLKLKADARSMEFVDGMNIDFTH
jgi:hypothetical protein